MPDTTARAVTVTAERLEHFYAPGRGLAATDFAASAPAVVAVTGHNGSGKSTLLRIVAGLLQPTRGTCTVAVAGAACPAELRRRVLGYAAPELSFYDELTVGENLRFAAEAGGHDTPHHAIPEALETVGLLERAPDRFAALSSGMKQRVRLAFAVLHRPPLLLLDEPGSHLDEAGRDIVARIVERQRAHGLVLLATNDEREWRLADERIELRGRRLGNPA